MGNKIQLKHPQGKKAINMDAAKYELMKTAIRTCLQEAGSLSHSEMKAGVTIYFSQNKIRFPGSTEWHMEWVKLDLEAQGLIRRTELQGSIRYTLS